jgi:pentatricopeptide repeat protein
VFLEAQIRAGTAPTMVVNILANTYAKVGRTQDAIRVWRYILATATTDEQRIVAAKELQEIYSRMKREKASPR